MGVPGHSVDTGNMTGTFTKALHLNRGSSQERWPSLSNMRSSESKPTNIMCDRLRDRRKGSLDELSLRRDIAAGLAGSSVEGPSPDSSCVYGTSSGDSSGMEGWGSTADLDQAVGQSTILNKLLKDRNKSLDELSIGSDVDLGSSWSAKMSGFGLSRTSTFADLTAAGTSIDDNDIEEDTCQGDNFKEDMYSKSYGGESNFKHVGSSLLSRRMKSLDDPTCDGSAPAPGCLSRRPTVLNLNLDIDDSVRPRHPIPTTTCDRKPGDEDGVDGVDGGGGRTLEELVGVDDPVRHLVQTPAADILQVLMLHTDSQLLKQLSKEHPGGMKNGSAKHDNLEKNSEQLKKDTESSGADPDQLSPMRPRAKTAGNGVSAGTSSQPITPGAVQMRTTRTRSMSAMRRSIVRRTLLARDDLYDKVNAAITPRPKSRRSGHFTYDMLSPGGRRTPLSAHPGHTRTPTFLNAPLPLPPEDGLRVGLPPGDTLSEGEVARDHPPGSASVCQTPLEYKIGRILRAKGDAAAEDLLAVDFAPAVSEILRDVSYTRFSDVISRSVGSGPGWRQVAGLVNVARSAVQWAGYGTTAALRVKEVTLKYFEDHLSGWVLGQGGWESMVGEEVPLRDSEDGS